MGSVAYATGTDIDGEAWSNPPSIGCDEYHPGAVTGPLTVSLVANFTNTTVAYPVSLTALIAGRTSCSIWDFGDGVVMSNRPYASHAWAAPGVYPVALRAYNESIPGGVTANVTIHVVKQPVVHVAAASTNPQPPYASWTTAATSIQDAVNATTVAGALVLVTNGVYAGGLGVSIPLVLRSVNGPQFTVIDGGGTNQCANLTTGASLTGFTVTNGFASGFDSYVFGFGYFGGGVCCASPNAFVTNCVIVGNLVNDSGGGAYGCMLYNCTLAGNAAAWVGGGAVECTLYNCTLTSNLAAVWGGGAYGSTFYNCTLTGNSAPDWYGGGAAECTLYNCTLTGNSAMYGGGAAFCTLGNCMLTGNLAGDFGGGADGCTLYNCTLTGNSAWSQAGGAEESRLNNCILYFNTAVVGANYYSNGYSTLNYCSTTPIPTNGVGNITNAPLFVDDTHGNLRLQSDSPCINAGNNAYATTPTDLDGNLRIVSGTVDIGAYEYQGAGSVISYAWLQYYGLPTDGSADYADTDHDGLNNWQEWMCGTDPTDAASVLKMLAPSKNVSGITVNWESVNTRTYYLQRSTNLATQPAFLTIQSNIVGQADTTTCADTNATGAGPFFYRVGVEWP
jgi:parallel beta-helix repeat protein